ncbi:hypothetical protein [Candidatus Palauibacter sp.]|uniref:hypothetical protein n=1 Tax=Candidatus Palauibacter sp. TaxID=3101350 RepID=UPI003AF26AEB
MVIAVVAVLMVQVPVDDVVGVPVMSHGLVAAVLSVYVPVVMALAPVIVTGRRSVVIAVVAVLMVQVPVDDVVGVPVVFHGLVAAVLSVYMLVVVTFAGVIVSVHESPSF